MKVLFIFFFVLFSSSKCDQPSSESDVVCQTHPCGSNDDESSLSNNGSSVINGSFTGKQKAERVTTENPKGLQG